MSPLKQSVVARFRHHHRILYFLVILTVVTLCIWTIGPQTYWYATPRLRGVPSLHHSVQAVNVPSFSEAAALTSELTSRTGNGDTCFQRNRNTKNTTPPISWTKCKQQFVTPNVTLVTPRMVRVGQTIRYRIECRVERVCILGGNFWYAVFTSTAEPPESCTGSVVDYCNGSYDVYTTASWVGDVSMKLILVHTGEAIVHLRNVVWPAEDRLSFTGYYQVGNSTTDELNTMPHGECKLRPRANWRGYCTYPHPRAMGNTTTICRKPEGVPCNTLQKMSGFNYRIMQTAEKLAKYVEYLFKSPNYLTPVSVQDDRVTIIVGNGLSKLLSCYPNQPIPAFQGYWQNGVWHSRLCAINPDWTVRSRLLDCLQHKQLILLGDSTTRQWFTHLDQAIGLRGDKQPNVYCCHTLISYKTLNTTMLFRIHPHVLASYAVDIHDVQFEVDVLDGLNDPTCNYIIVLGPWAHFVQWPRDSYIERTLLLKEAVLRFRERCPDAPIIFRGPHPREHRTFFSILYSSDYIAKQIGDINQEIFRGTGVWFLPIWDMNLAYPAENVVHMPPQVIREEIKMFLSFACERD